MIQIFVRAIVLFVHAHALWPSVPIGRVAVASLAAAEAETPEVDGSILLAIAQHESDLRPTTISWRSAGHRIDAMEMPAEFPVHAVCGLVQSVAPDRAACAVLSTPRGAMAAGVAELAEWLATCRGSMRCALAGYAYGQRGIEMWRADALPLPNFADLFIAQARRLGAPRKKPTS